MLISHLGLACRWVTRTWRVTPLPSMVSFVHDILPLLATEHDRLVDCTTLSLFSSCRQASEMKADATVCCVTYGNKVKLSASRPAIPSDYQLHVCRGCLRLVMVAERLVSMRSVLVSYIRQRSDGTINVARDVQICNSLIRSLAPLASELLTAYWYPQDAVEWMPGQRILSSHHVDETLGEIYTRIEDIEVPLPLTPMHDVLAAYEDIEDSLKFVMGRHLIPYAAIASLAVPPPNMEEVLRLGEAATSPWPLHRFIQ